MSRGINKVILIGNIGAAPEFKQTQTGLQIATLQLATSTYKKDKDGVQKTNTQWHKLVFYNRLAEVAAQYLKKGSKIYVEGQIRYKKWQDDTGNNRSSTEIVVIELTILDKKNIENRESKESNETEQEHDYERPYEKIEEFTDAPF